MIQPQVVTQNDFGQSLPYTLQDGSQNPVDLTGATVQIKVQNSQDPTDTLKFTGTLTIDSAAQGTCHYVVASGNFDTPGVFLATITATWGTPATKVQTWPTFQIIVQPSLPNAAN